MQSVRKDQGRDRTQRTDGHDAQTPNVYFGTVCFSGDNFGCHPVRRADHGGTFGLRWIRYLRAKTKVGCGKRIRKKLADMEALTEFDIALHAQQNIVALDVAVNDTVPV